MYFRARFEDGQEKRVEWDELGFATENLYSVLWSYPARTDAPIGPVLVGPTGDSVGGDQELIQDMMKHETMLSRSEHQLEKDCLEADRRQKSIAPRVN